MMGLTERHACRLPGPVDPGAVVDAQHNDGVLVLVDLVEHPVGAAACRVQSHEFTLKAAVPSVPVGGHLAFLFDDHALADEAHTVRG